MDGIFGAFCATRLVKFIRINISILKMDIALAQLVQSSSQLFPCANN